MASSTTKHAPATRRKTTPAKSTKATTATPRPTKAAAKTATKAKPPLAAVPDPVAVPTEPVTPMPDLAPLALKKRELLRAVAERSGLRRRDAKQAVEAMLEVLGETLAEGREINLQPMGKLILKRSTERGPNRISILKLRQRTKSDEIPATEPLADPAE